MSWKRIGQSNTYEAHLAYKSLRRHAAGKKMTAAGRRAMLNMGYIDEDGAITVIGKHVLRGGN
ncbi:hypothetical protein [Corynebacterium matruchotii]|uniref:hypothetical protein n=1 Tax=Corynebacterium matruchotii TaxID=43768 RepID=UPI00288BC2CB|nr:hypothetical protein [Corynebacterium matruchotii]